MSVLRLPMQDRPKQKRRAHHAINSDLEKYRIEAIKIARELRYPQETIFKIKQASSAINISNIMKNARYTMCNE